MVNYKQCVCVGSSNAVMCLQTHKHTKHITQHSTGGVSPVTPMLAKSVTLHLIPSLPTLSSLRCNLRLCSCVHSTHTHEHTLNLLCHQLQYLDMA